MPLRRLPFSPSVAAALTFGSGLVASCALFAAVYHLERDNIRLGFEQRAGVRAAAVRQGLEEATEVLAVTNQLFVALPSVSREQFRTFTAPLLRRHRFIQAFNFHRIVDDAGRAALEASLQQVRPGTVVTELRDGRQVPATRRLRYQVVDYLEPLAGNEAALGADAGIYPELAGALERARASGAPAMTGLLGLAQDNGRKLSFQVLMPVHGPQGDPVGDTSAVIRADVLVRTTLERAGLLDKPGVALSVYTGERADPARLVYASSTPRPAPGWLARWLVPEQAAQLDTGFTVGGRSWLVRASALPHSFLSDHLGSTCVLVGGLLLTLLSAVLVQSAATRTRRVQQLVGKRTADLKRTNRRLIGDVVARQRTEKALQESELRFRQLVAMSSDWYWEQDPELRFTMVTGGFAGKAGITVERVLGKTFVEFLPALAQSDEGRAHLAQVRAREAFYNFEFQVLDDNGETRWLCINGQPVTDSAGRFAGYRGTGSDITARKQAEQRVHHVAQHDVLTGLPNRSLLQDRLSQAISYSSRSGHPVWVMLIDLDRFKFVNDSMGHKAGDVLLVTVAARLRSSLRDTDTVARLSGDEFVVILSEHQDQALSPEIVERVMNAVAQPVMLGNKEFMVTCSIGVAVYPSEGTPAESLIEHADIAMYRAKKLGRNNSQFYTPAMNEESQERVRIEGALRTALERGELVLHYQPQVDLESGRIVGMEALVRWQHPELGMVPPSRFIGVAEETGLIVPIGAWVMRTACAQCRAWQDAGLGRLRVGVNLSARQFGARDLIEGIEAVLADTGLDADCLELELTESLFLSDVTPAVELLHRMKALGVKLSIDDFGTGYSSLSYLSRFPIDTLKIDRSFVADITHDANDAAIVTSIIALAHNLKLAVIAEGVESGEQLDYLRRHGCDEIQGYYFSAPLTTTDFEQMLRQQRALAPELAENVDA